MTFPLAGIVTRRLAVSTVALMLLAFAGVTAAAADGHDGDDADATASDTMHEVEVLDTVVEAEADGTEETVVDPDADPDADDAARTDGDADADDADADDADDADAGAGADDADAGVSTTQATTAEICTPMLVTHRADGSSGDQQAVSITAQAQEFGVAGWVNVAWQAADGAQLTAVTVTGMDGTVTTRTSQLLAGSAVDVLELRFCGTYDGEVSVDAGPPPSEEADESAVADDVATDEGADDDSTGAADTSTGSEADDTSTDTANLSGAGDDAIADGAEGEAPDEETEPLGVVSVPTPESDDDTDDGTDATANSADPDEPETEVLGVQLTQDSSSDSDGGLATALGLLLLALVAGGAAFLGFRRMRA